MCRYSQAAGSPSLGRPGPPHKADDGGGAIGTGPLVDLRDCTQSLAKQLVAPQDLLLLQQVLHPHPVALFRGRRILGGNPLVGKQLQIVPCRRYSDIEACRHLSSGCRTVLRQEPNDGHPGQIPKRINDRLHVSSGFRMGIPGHTCNLAASA